MSGLRPLGALAAVALACGRASATIGDIGRLTMGRTTFPEGAWVVDYFQDHAVRWTSPMSHALGQRAVVAHGLSDRLSLGAIAMTFHAERRPAAVDRWGAAAQYRLSDSPVEFAPMIAAFPAPGRRAEFVLGADILANVGEWTLHLGYADEFKRGEGELAYGFNHHFLEPGVFRRFGLHGMLGVQYTYQTRRPPRNPQPADASTI